MNNIDMQSAARGVAEEIKRRHAVEISNDTIDWIATILRMAERSGQYDVVNWLRLESNTSRALATVPAKEDASLQAQGPPPAFWRCYADSLDFAGRRVSRVLAALRKQQDGSPPLRQAQGEEKG